MKRWIFVACLSLALATVAGAQLAPLVRDLVESALEQLGRREAGELAKFGGEAAAREVFEKAAQEGGETAVRQLAGYTERYGVAALRAVETAPGRMLTALDQVGGDLLEPAIRAAAREPAVVSRLVGEYGEQALVVAAEHPGVGTDIAATLGRDGIEAAAKIPTPEAVRLARYSRDIAEAPVPAASRKGVLEAIGRAPGRVLDEIERHPNLLLTAAGCATLIAISHDAKHNIFGEPGQPGLVDRVTGKIVDTFKTPVSAVILLAGLGLLAWFGAKIYLLLRRPPPSKPS